MPLVSNPLSPSSNFRVEVGKIPPSPDLFPYRRVAARIAVRLSATLYKRLIETKKGLASMKGRVEFSSTLSVRNNEIDGQWQGSYIYDICISLSLSHSC